MKPVKILCGILLSCLLTLLPVAASEPPLVVDGADLLSASEEGDLLTELKTLRESYACDVAVITVTSLGGKSAMAYADDYYDDNGYGYGPDDDGILLLIAIEERQWAIFTYGLGQEVLTEAALDRIEDDMVPDLSRGDYAGACRSFASGCEEALQNPSGFSWKTTLLISLVVGIILAFVTVSVMKGQLISVKSRNEANDYVRRDSLNLRNARDIYLYRTVSRVRRDTDSSGGRTHRSSSGRSHGGRSGSF